MIIDFRYRRVGPYRGGGFRVLGRLGLLVLTVASMLVSDWAIGASEVSAQRLGKIHDMTLTMDPEQRGQDSFIPGDDCEKLRYLSESELRIFIQTADPADFENFCRTNPDESCSDYRQLREVIGGIFAPNGSGYYCRFTPDFHQG